MNLIIVTCPRLASDRLLRQVAEINSAIGQGLITCLQIICMDDVEAQRLVTIRYCPERWSSDIAIGWEFFKKNIISFSQNGDQSPKSLIDVLSSSLCFPSRPLTPSEHSIALRHILAIEAIARADCPCIVLEDDALVANNTLFHELITSFRNYSRSRMFYDLADQYIPDSLTNSRLLQVGSLQYTARSTAITRTLMAYAMLPHTADLLLNSLTHYSLPIDMQLQVVLCKLGIPGLSLRNSPFRHGSKTNAMPSSVRQS